MAAASTHPMTRTSSGSRHNLSASCKRTLKLTQTRHQDNSFKFMRTRQAAKSAPN